MKQIILLALITCSSLAYSQEYSNTLPEVDWQLHEVPTNVSFAYDFSSNRSFEKGIVYVSESEAVAPVHYSKGYGLVKINKNGEVVWNTPVPGYILGVSKFKGSILVVYTPDWNEKRDGWAVIGQASIALFDIGTGKKLKEAVFYDAKSTFTEITTVSKPSDEFSCILVRTTPYNGGNSIKKNELIATTLKLSALELGDDLKVVKETAINVANEAAFVGSVANENGELFIATIADKKIRVEKFNPSFASQQKLESSINYSNKFPPRHIVLALDDQNSQSVLFATYFGGIDDKVYSNQFWNFQFGTGKVSTSGAELMTKDFFRSIPLVNNDKGKRIDLKNIDAMGPVGIVTSKDKIIVLKEAKGIYSLGGPSSGTRYVNGDLLVSFYDKEGKLLKHVAFDKKYESFLSLDRSIGYKLRNNKLYIVTNGMPGGLRFPTMLCVINTDQMTMESLGQKLEEVRIKGELPVAGGGTFWFNNTLVLTHMPTLKRSALRKVEL